MKVMKRFLAVALAMMMCLGLTTVAMAADITVENAAKGETYTAYKVFDATKSDGGSYAYQMAADSVWKSVVEGYQVGGTNVFTLTPSKSDANVLVVESTLTEAQAEDFAAYLVQNKPASAEAKVSGEVGEDKVATIDVGEDDGYYLVTSSLGTIAILDTAVGGGTMREKNPLPNIDKSVDAADLANGVGGVLEYTVTIEAETGAKGYAVHDQMSKGLTFNNDVVVTLAKYDAATQTYGEAATVAASNYTVSTEDITDDCTFEVTFDQAFLDGLKNKDRVVVTYSATINAEAVELNTVTNTAQLKYGNNSWSDSKNNPETELSQITVNKVDGLGAALAGAKFKLYGSENGADEILLVYDETNACYRPALEGETAAEVVAGTAVIKGLTKGSYYLEETEAPDGYNMLTAREDASTTDGDAAVTVTNQQGQELPSTGGIGTTIFYVVGGLLVVGAGVLLITKKRMAHHD
ncbi:SpaH/EbpB family LPXTG-anchored major pilin [Hominifimenecus sp. rT4P-3]|uniref:SpaH/EbpB family LPXTG-anchored major pilin n=1 Tax=Hominifimenecus sp. rT4P-3 TaxID=3242979 RepID=UPI003DA399E9